MAKKVSVVLIDDLDGETADQTVTFGLDGTTYEIDLKDENAGKLRDAMALWIAHARRVGRTSRPSAAESSSGGRSPARVDREQLQAVREWARRNGHEVSDRGRIPAKIMEAFESANG